MQHVLPWIESNNKIWNINERENTNDTNFQWPIPDEELPDYRRQQYENRVAMLQGMHSQHIYFAARFEQSVNVPPLKCEIIYHWIYMVIIQWHNFILYIYIYIYKSV